MLKTVSIVAFLALPFLCFSQRLSKDFDVSIGSAYQVVDGPSKEYIPIGNGELMAVKTRGPVVTVQRLGGDDLKEIARNEYEDFPKYSKVQDVIKLGDKIFYLFEAYNKKEKTFTFYSREVNNEDASFKAAKKLFTTGRPVVNNPGGPMRFPMTALANTGKKFMVHTSFDNSKVLIQYRSKPLSKRDSKNFDELGFFVFDTNMEKVWGKDVTMPYTEKEMNNLAYTVGKDGTAYMLAFIRESKKMELFSITGDAEMKVMKLDVDGEIVFQEMNLRENEKGNLICAGFYASGIDFKVNWTGDASLDFNTRGIYYFESDRDGKILTKKNNEFPMELIKQYLKPKQQEKLAKREKEGKAGIENLRMTEFFVDADGSIFFIGEQQYCKQEMYMASKQWVYHYANVVMTKMDKNGDVVWMKKLPKNQAGVRGQGQMSAMYVKGNGAHYLLFVDNPKNEHLGMHKVPEAHKDGMGGYLTALKVDDSTGEFERHTVADIKNIKGTEAHQFKTTRIVEVADQVFVMEAYVKGKKDKLIRMELKN